MISDDNEKNCNSPVPKKKYKLYKSDSTISIPLRTLNRWRAQGYSYEGNSSNYVEDNFATNIPSCTESDEEYSELYKSDVDSILSNSSSEDEEENEDLFENSDHETSSNFDNEDSEDNNDEYVNNYEDNEDQETNDNINEIEADNENVARINTLFEDSILTTDKCVFDLLNLYINHNITKAALQDILTLQLKFLPTHHEMPKTVFKLFKYAKDIAPPCKIIKHFYCRKCLFNVDIVIINKKEIKKCSLCDTSEPLDIGFFHEFDIVDQIKFLFEQNNLAEKLKTNSTNNENISDITDGTEYIRVNSRDNRSTYDLTLILNTDGLSLVKSAKSHCWPIMFTVAELPEYIREKHIIITGLWYDDHCKPPMNLFLRPICCKLKECFIKGIDWVHPKTGNSVNSKITAPLIIADAPARAQIQNILSFNGRYGCNICEIRTVRSKNIPGKKACRIYPYKTDFRVRIGERMEKQAKKLLRTDMKHQIRGVKGYSIMSCLPLTDISTCVFPEYMHSVLLGVVKQVIGIWFSAKALGALKIEVKKLMTSF
ncbi:uncharacterized protein LOC141525650 [Cotesia typhae]|uniref:uncharacterized protein LOC141525650 n=1 Tax=Cotesia typhae TaxID=2053667 RepID=UPI003D688404